MFRPIPTERPVVCGGSSSLCKERKQTPIQSIYRIFHTDLFSAGGDFILHISTFNDNKRQTETQLIFTISPSDSHVSFIA